MKKERKRKMEFKEKKQKNKNESKINPKFKECLLNKEKEFVDLLEKYSVFPHFLSHLSQIVNENVEEVTQEGKFKRLKESFTQNMKILGEYKKDKKGFFPLSRQKDDSKFAKFIIKYISSTILYQSKPYYDQEVDKKQKEKYYSSLKSIDYESLNQLLSSTFKKGLF